MNVNRRVLSMAISVVVGCILLIGYSLVTADRRTRQVQRSVQGQLTLVERGRYLATIGACAGCHTPPAVENTRPAAEDATAVERDRKFRTDPDWYRYLDPNRYLSGGVPFYLRFSGKSNGVVYSSNITPDPATGLEPCGARASSSCWTEDDLVNVIRAGKRKQGANPQFLFLFPPHSFYRNMADDDVRALVAYVRSLAPIRNDFLQGRLRYRRLSPERSSTQVATVKAPEFAPKGRSAERGLYLMNALVGCRECHSFQKFTASGPILQEFVGGDPSDPFLGVFRLGPDLPLRADEKGFAVFPYPGYAVLYSSNLTRFGIGGDLRGVPDEQVVRAIRGGISTEPDRYGRPSPLEHVMLWQFYASMADDDVYAIVAYLRTLKYVPHVVEPRLLRYGTDWEAAFRQVFGRFNVLTGESSDTITETDRELFGKGTR
ncbi:MAG TPA: hypothetical protein VKT83_06020 [bacterium]|nr:hypothetical protein [bacterium]